MQQVGGERSVVGFVVSLARKTQTESNVPVPTREFSNILHLV